MSKIDRYLDSLLNIPTWIGFPIFFFSLFIPMVLAVFIIFLLVATVSPWFLLAPVVIWAACAINWWLKSK